jgi:hypothetical protein
MSVQRKHTEVRIDRRTLWIGAQAYPLHMVANVEPVEIVPNRSELWLEYARNVTAWVGGGVAGLTLLFLLTRGGLAVTVGSVLGTFVAGAAVVHTSRLIRRLTAPHLYVLNIAMTGGAHAGLVSDDRQLIHDLTDRLVDAIDGPAAEYAIHVNHIDVTGGTSILGRMTATLATPTSARNAAPARPGTAGRSSGHSSGRADPAAGHRADTDATARQLAQLRALVEREGQPAVQDALTTVLLTLRDVATATAAAARERS